MQHVYIPAVYHSYASLQEFWTYPQVQFVSQLQHLSSSQGAELLVLIVEVFLKGWIINLYKNKCQYRPQH